MEHTVFSKVITVTLNPALDATIWTENLDFNEPVGTLKEEVYAGGKSVNVSRVLTRLGVPNKLVGIVGQENIVVFEKLLLKDKVDFDFIATKGFVRENLTLVFPNENVLKINRQGSDIKLSSLKQLFSR
ncbi:MAG: 1-phosphofructokinase, partial [Oscillospiraceae bacterium]|nr:1-phosphofructokinase [Oscillospiraceae bacterium]